MSQDIYGLEDFELSHKMARLSDGLAQDFWEENSDDIERFVRVNAHDPELMKRFYEGLENRVVNKGLQDLGVRKYKDLMSALLRSKFWRLFQSRTHSLRGDQPMRDFNRVTASRLQKWAEKADTPDDKTFLAKMAQMMGEEMMGSDPASQGGMSDTELEEGLAPGMNSGMDVVDLSTGDNPETQKGEFDITREPASPMWDVELLRVKANAAEEAQEIVEKFVGWARNHGQPRMSVGTIKRSRDADANNK